MLTGPRSSALDAEEPVVKARDVLGRDADPGVLDAQDDGAVGGVQRHGDRSALIERIEPPPIEAIPGRVDRGQQPKRQTFDRPQHR